MLRKISQNFSSSIQTEYDSLLFSIKKKTMKKRVMIRKFVLKVDTFMQWRRTWLLYFSSKAILQIFAFISARFVGIGKIVECFCFFSMLRWYHYMTQKRWEFCALFPQIALKLIWIIVGINIFHWGNNLCFHFFNMVYRTIYWIYQMLISIESIFSISFFESYH